MNTKIITETARKTLDDTMAVLLADISGLIYNAKNEKSKLPGFLLHDSPREADLGKRIYWSYPRFLARASRSDKYPVLASPFKFLQRIPAPFGGTYSSPLPAHA